MNPAASVLIDAGTAGGGHSRPVARAARCGAIVVGVVVLHGVLLVAVLHGEPVRVEHEHVRVITATLLAPTSSAMPDTPSVAAQQRNRAPKPVSPPVRHVPLPRVSRTPSPVSLSRPAPLPVASVPSLPATTPAETASRNASDSPVTEPTGSLRESGATQAASMDVTPRRVAHLDCAMVKPEYPPPALRRRQAGTVVVELETDPSGRVSTARVTTSSGYALLDEAARDAVSASRCRPYIENSTPVPARADVPVTFNLDE